MEDAALAKFVNKIFSHEGIPAVKNFAEEFSNGSKCSSYWPSLVLFEKLFNILYEEKIDCKLSKSVLFDDKLLNWNRINAVICFNYL